MDKQHLLEAIVESASQGIVAVDRRGRILFANQAAAALFGYGTTELVGSELELLLPEHARMAHKAHFERYAAAPVVRPMGIGMDLAARRKDGSEFPVEVSLSYVRSGGDLIGIALVSDVTTRKQFELQVTRSQRMDVVGRLAGGIAHDFNNMLTIILGYDRLLLQRMSPLDALRGYAEEIGRAAERASALTRHLLAFSKHVSVQREVTDVNGVIEDAARLLAVATGEHIRIVTELDAHLGLTLIDREQFHQVLANVIMNARDAMPKGGQITIQTANVELGAEYIRAHLGVKAGPYVLISIADTGTGMDAETKEHIFEPFFTTKGPDHGTGLGLTTVWATIKNFGGDIWVYSEVGNGTTFKIYLPRVNEEGKRLLETPREANAGGGHTVLVVEDEPGVRELAVELMNEQGYKVLSAGDGMQAIQRASAYEGQIHLLLTDVVMPRMNGFELATRLRESRPGLKVLYMSGYAESNPLLSANSVGPESLVQKPFTFEDLLSKVRTAIGT